MKEVRKFNSFAEASEFAKRYSGLGGRVKTGKENNGNIVAISVIFGDCITIKKNKNGGGYTAYPD